MIHSCIVFLLQCDKKVTRKAVLSLCRNGLEREGGLFETEPQFDFNDEFVQVFDYESIADKADKIMDNLFME
jgi:hypothetical protein